MLQIKTKMIIFIGAKTSSFFQARPTTKHVLHTNYAQMVADLYFLELGKIFFIFIKSGGGGEEKLRLENGDGGLRQRGCVKVISKVKP